MNLNRFKQKTNNKNKNATIKDKKQIFCRLLVLRQVLAQSL